MKLWKLSFALLLSVFTAGCIESTFVYTLNPDNSCKVDMDTTVTLPTEVFQCVEDLDLATYKAIYTDSAKNKIKTKMLPYKGIDAWSDITWWVSDDRKIHSKATAYIKDVNGAAGTQSALGKITWKKNDNGETVLEMSLQPEKVAKTPPAEMSQEDLTDKIKQTREKWEATKDIFSKSIGLSKAHVNIKLPGKVSQVSGFGKNEDGSISYEMDGPKYLDRLEKILADDKALGDLIKSGKNPLDPITMAENMLDMFGTKGPFKVVLTGEIKPLFDYKAEMEKAKAAMPELIKKLDFEEDSIQTAASQPTPQQAAIQAEYKKKVEDFKKDFPFVPISDWKGMKFVFLKKEKDFQKYGYQHFTGGKGKNGLVTYDEAVGRVGTVIDTLVTKDLDISYNGKEVAYIALKMDDNSQIYIGKTGLPGQIDGIASVDEIEKAKNLFKGKTLYYTCEFVDRYPPDSKLNSLFDKIMVSIFTPLKVIDVELSHEDFAPVRFILETASGKKAYRDCSLSGTNDYERETEDERGNFLRLFYLDDLRKIYPWGDKVWIAIERGRLLLGMTTEQVKFIGKPYEIKHTATSEEQWKYGLKNEFAKNITELTFENGVLKKIDKHQKSDDELKASALPKMPGLSEKELETTTKPGLRPVASVEEIKKLVGQLGDKDSKIREEARRKLIAIGDPALSIVQNDREGKKDILLVDVLKEISIKSTPFCMFYGLIGHARQVVYVIDRGGYMIGTFDYLRIGLLDSLFHLKESQDFHMIFFSSRDPIESPPKKLVTGSEKNITTCADFLKTVEASGQTDPVPALKRAFELFKDSPRNGKLIYLLVVGEFPDKEAVLKLIKEQNPEGENQIMIYTYLFEEKNKEAEAVLQKIANENKGAYKFIDPEEEYEKWKAARERWKAEREKQNK